ncbi:hypothetical protein B5C34_07465 [Pacificimonas flava]|uniref:DUF2093 domain-containing protein n=2 Tax=Pacificimonas TaxID=1960290 RepID=A0A219B4I5_9SPHN|nr:MULTISPECIES: DUF2093 domain-containing protein [Pacificimonas]MBZ6379502.1 DUF2093 domain-containing protein [Pacificimonas aurantium]OWV33310.1 hypothetical protein B5C34_07465 [Pacificimonas flava]
MLKLGKDRLARLDYQSGSFRVVSAGDHVFCAVSGEKIPLADLRYWSHELQEAYKNAETANVRYAEARQRGDL